jgi:hypothetical protein
MPSRAIFACSTTVLALSALVRPALASESIFDSLDGATSSAAYADGIDPVMSATFSTGATPVRVDVALLLFDGLQGDGEPNATYTVSLDGGIPLSKLSFDPIEGLNYLNGSPVDLLGPVIKSVTFPATSLAATPEVERFDQFASVQLNPNSLYWIEVRVNGYAVVEWGTTADIAGPGVASNYLAWGLTDNGFFLNRGVDPFPFDNALQMEVDAVPEPSTWAMMVAGFAALGYAGYRAARRSESAIA